MAAKRQQIVQGAEERIGAPQKKVMDRLGRCVRVSVISLPDVDIGMDGEEGT